MRFIDLRAAEMHEHRELNAISLQFQIRTQRLIFITGQRLNPTYLFLETLPKGHEYENKFLIPHNYYFKRQNVITVIIKFFIYA